MSGTSAGGLFFQKPKVSWGEAWPLSKCNRIFPCNFARGEGSKP